MCMEIDGNYINVSAHNRHDLLHNVVHFIIVGINFIASFLYMEHIVDSRGIKCHLLEHNVILDILFQLDMRVDLLAYINKNFISRCLIIFEDVFKCFV